MQIRTSRLLIYLGLTRPISELMAKAFMTTELTRCLRLMLVAAEPEDDDAVPFSLLGLPADVGNISIISHFIL
jgi:hypothetical protein